MIFVINYLKCPLLEIEASGFGVPLRAASCCSKALDSKYSSHAAASYNIIQCMNYEVFVGGRKIC